MTNKEKARDLAIKSTIHLNDEGKEVYNALVEAALQEMAEWKEQQMIDKAVEWVYDLRRRYVVRNFHTGDIYTEKDMIHNLKQFLQGYPEKEVKREELFQQTQYQLMVKQLEGGE